MSGQHGGASLTQTVDAPQESVRQDPAPNDVIISELGPPEEQEDGSDTDSKILSLLQIGASVQRSGAENRCKMKMT